MALKNAKGNYLKIEWPRCRDYVIAYAIYSSEETRRCTSDFDAIKRSDYMVDPVTFYSTMDGAVNADLSLINNILTVYYGILEAGLNGMVDDNDEPVETWVDC